MADRLMAALERCPALFGDHTVIAAVSGGRDSVAMLHALQNLSLMRGFELSAVHVNHHLRPEATEEAAFVQRLCRDWHIPLTVVEVDVLSDKQTGESTETAARRLRYRAFTQLTMQCEHAVLATAHHGNDQAETVLMHLLRGSGTRGLSGIAPMRDRFIRPLLGVTRAEIDLYCAKNRLLHVEDASNLDTEITRNRIRHELLPMLETFNPGVVTALIRTADTLREDEEFIVKVAMQAMTTHGFRVYGRQVALIDTGAFGQPLPICKRMIRIALEAIGSYDLTQTMLDQALRAIEKRTSTDLPGGVKVRGGATVQVYREAPPLLPLQVSVPSETVFGVFRVHIGLGTPPLRTAFCAHLQPEIAHRALTLRSRQAADRIKMPYGEALLSDLMIDRKVPYCLRDRMPILTVDGEPVWAPGLPPGEAVSQKNLDWNASVCWIAAEGIE